MAFEEGLTVALPILVGLGAVAFAMLERGYKRFLDEKKLAEADGKDLKFDMAYLINMVVSTGATAAFVSAIPLIVDAAGSPAEITFVTLLLNAVTGYTTAYTILDKLNKSTDVNIARANEIKRTREVKEKAKGHAKENFEVSRVEKDDVDEEIK